MAVRKQVVLVLSVMAIIMLTSCGAERTASPVQKSQSVQTSTAKNSAVTQPDYHADLKSEAKKYKSTTGKVALSMMICKLDNSHSYTDMLKLDASELFDILSESAAKKDITLETLNKNYDLLAILASEKIFVTIKANDVTYVSGENSTKGTAVSDPDAWIKQFQSSIISNK